MNYLTTEDGKPIKSTNPLPVSSVITDEDGNNVKISDSGEMKTVTTVTDADGNKLAILANGKLPVDLTLTGDTELAVNVAIQDGTDSTKKAKITEDGSLSVQLSGSKVTDITFHNAAVAATDGTALTLDGEKTLLVEILSTATSFTIAFMGEGPSGAAIPIMGVNLSTLATGINTSNSGELWQFDITGLTKVFMDLTAVTAGAGSVTVKGRAVA